MAGSSVPRFKRVKRLYETGAKVRNVLFLIYIEDLEKVGKGYGDIIAFLDSKHCKSFVSPVHDKDCWNRQGVWDWCERHVDPETGDLDMHYIDRAPYVGMPKKPHVHCGIASKSQRNAQEWHDFLLPLCDIRATMFEKMEDWAGSVRYAAHLDSPDKAPYPAMDVVGIAGADLSCLLRTDEHTRVCNFANLVGFVREQHITNFHTLVDCVGNSGDYEMLDTLNRYGSLMAAYFGSQRWARIDEAKARKRAAKAAKTASVL